MTSISHSSSTVTTPPAPPILLAPGHWLGGWAWDAVASELSAAGAVPVALTPPGCDPRDKSRSTRTLADQVASLEAAAASQRQPVTIVAHSGANAPVTLLLDRMPERIVRAVWVDSGPVADGFVFAASPDAVPSGGLPLPPFAELGAQASLEGLSVEMLDRFRERALPEPRGVLDAPVKLINEARYDVPTTFVCCSLPSAQVQQLAATGHPMFAEVQRYRSTTFVDLETGHWPMWSRPEALAKVIAQAAAL